MPMTTAPCGRSDANVMVRTLAACATLVLIAMIGAWLHRARSIETELAIELEVDLRSLGALRPDGTLHRAARLYDALCICIATSQDDFSSRDLNARVTAARSRAISNLVASLETYSGKQYGTNLQAWQDWLSGQSPQGSSEKP